jgi:hypothetical protein
VGVAGWPGREIGGDNIVAARDQGADQVVTDLAAGAGEEDLHAGRIIDRASPRGKPPGAPCGSDLAAVAADQKMWLKLT